MPVIDTAKVAAVCNIFPRIVNFKRYFRAKHVAPGREIRYPYKRLYSRYATTANLGSENIQPTSGIFLRLQR